MKFFNLLKKELAELINAQMILSLAIVMGMLFVLGNVMSSSIEEAVKQEYTITFCDRDKTEFTAELIDKLRENGAYLNEVTSQSEDYSELLDTAQKDSLVIFPKGFTEALENGEAPEIISVARMESAALMSNVSNNNDGASAYIRRCISDTFAERAGVTEEQLELINSPLTVTEQTVVGDKSAPISSASVMASISMKNMILPIVLFVLIMMVSQALMNSISNEKIDKTLETLLSTPVSRTAIISAKMLAAAIAAIINAIGFMLGFSGMMSGAAASVTTPVSTTVISEYLPTDEALEKLGLTISMGGYFLVGLQLFLTIMICLSLSIMLGALINDPKQSQTVVLPLMFGAMIPYMISMFADINSLPMVVRVIVYAIPFTHTFSAMSNIMFDHMAIFYGGLAYQAVVFVVCMFFALRLFNSDKILTISLNFGQKSKMKKNRKKA